MKLGMRRDVQLTALFHICLLQAPVEPGNLDFRRHGALVVFGCGSKGRRMTCAGLRIKGVFIVRRVTASDGASLKLGVSTRKACDGFAPPKLASQSGFFPPIAGCCHRPERPNTTQLIMTVKQSRASFPYNSAPVQNKPLQGSGGEEEICMHKERIVIYVLSDFVLSYYVLPSGYDIVYYRMYLMGFIPEYV